MLPTTTQPAQAVHGHVGKKQPPAGHYCTMPARRIIVRISSSNGIAVEVRV